MIRFVKYRYAPVDLIKRKGDEIGTVDARFDFLDESGCTSKIVVGRLTSTSLIDMILATDRRLGRMRPRHTEESFRDDYLYEHRGRVLPDGMLDRLALRSLDEMDEQERLDWRKVDY